MDIFSTLWAMLTRPFATLADIRRDQLLFQGIIMTKLEELLIVSSEAAAAAEAASVAANAALEAVKTIQPAVDAFEARITDLLKNPPDDLDAQLQVAIDTLRGVVATSKKSAEDAIAAAAAATATAADATDGVDEAKPIDPPTDPVDPPIDPDATSRKSSKHR